MDVVNIRVKYELRSFTHSWDNRGYRKNLSRPWIRPFFSQNFNGLLLGWTLRIYVPNLKFVDLRVPEIIGALDKLRVDVTSDVTTTGSIIIIRVDRLDSLCIRWLCYENCRRYSMLKVVMSRLWRHMVTWRHRGGHHSIAPGHFPIGSP